MPQMLTGEELRQWLEKELVTELLDMRFRRFFVECGCIDLFNPMEEMPAETVTYPFTKRNRNIVTAYIRAYEDAEQMIEIINGNREVSAAYYKGKSYAPNDLPTVEHSHYMERMLPKVKNVYREIYTYLRNGSRGKEVQGLYEHLFALNKRIEAYQQAIIKPAEKMVEEWNSSNKEDKDEAQLLQGYERLLAELHDMMPTMLRMLSEELHADDTCADLYRLSIQATPPKMGLDSDAQMKEINTCLSLLSPFLELLQQQYAELKLAIGRIAQAEEEVELVQ